mmetsp:Transcript_107421/g.346930  ORF Transcript_107421/g.346930 Transcript_107421/m.346930 type:complete len:271 (-) Transcript_107421:84-896(-)
MDVQLVPRPLPDAGQRRPGLPDPEVPDVRGAPQRRRLAVPTVEVTDNEHRLGIGNVLAERPSAAIAGPKRLQTEGLVTSCERQQIASECGLRGGEARQAIPHQLLVVLLLHLLGPHGSSHPGPPRRRALRSPRCRLRQPPALRASVGGTHLAQVEVADGAAVDRSRRADGAAAAVARHRREVRVQSRRAQFHSVALWALRPHLRLGGSPAAAIGLVALVLAMGPLRLGLGEDEGRGLRDSCPSLGCRRRRRGFATAGGPGRNGRGRMCGH